MESVKNFAQPFDLKWIHKSTSSILLAHHPIVKKLAKLEMRKVAASPATDILVLFLINPGKEQKVPTEFHLMHILLPQAPSQVNHPVLYTMAHFSEKAELRLMVTRLIRRVEFSVGEI